MKIINFKYIIALFIIFTIISSSVCLKDDDEGEET